VRRLMNYNALGDLPYLFKYVKNNRKQLSAMKHFIEMANARENIKFVFVSQWIKNAAESDLGISISRSHVIPNGVDTTQFEYQKKSEDDRLKILLIRSFIARNYSNDLSVDAIIELSKKSFFRDLHFTIYGEGYLFKPLINKVKHFANVEVHNSFVENSIIPSIHKNHGIFLCPSRLDTQGVSMCEAMASGLVPITSPIGGIPEYATDQVSSFQVKTGKEIAEKIEYLYKYPDVFLEMSKKARLEIVNKCNLSTTVAREVELINNLKTT
jgi:L-malate glycosyltransferase